MVFDVFPSPLGELLLMADDRGLLALKIPGQKYVRYSAAIPQDPENRNIQAAKVWLNQYFAGQRPDPGTVPVHLEGTTFQMQVWQLLLQIPYGETRTYGQIARALGVGCPQAVGGAVGRNPVAILVPCHRILGAGGRLTGYNGGLDRKIWLLRHEGIKFAG